MFSAHNSLLFIANRRGEVGCLWLSLGDPELARGYRRHTVRRHRSVFGILANASHTLLIVMLSPIAMPVGALVRLNTSAHLMECPLNDMSSVAQVVTVKATQ